MSLELVHELVGSQAFLSRLFPSGTPERPEGLVVLTVKNSGHTVRLELHRLEEAGPRRLWHGPQSLVVIVGRQALILEAPHRGTVFPRLLDLSLHHPWEWEAEGEALAGPLVSAYSAGGRVWVQDRDMRLHRLEVDGPAVDSRRGPVLDGFFHCPPRIYHHADGSARLALGTEGGIMTVKPETLEVDQAMCFPLESSSLESLHLLPCDRLLMVERHTLTALAPGRRGLNVEWRHPLRCWTNGVTLPISLGGRIWYATGNGQIVGVTNGEADVVKITGDFRPCVARGLVVLSEDKALVVDRGGRLVMLETDTGCIRELTFERTAANVPGEVIVDSVRTVGENILINWRAAKEDAHAWRATMLKYVGDGQLQFILTADIGMVIGAELPEEESGKNCPGLWRNRN